MIQYNRSSSTGTFNSVAAASKKSGSTVAIGRDYQRVANLVALVNVEAETNGTTLTPQWEVSNDNLTFYKAMQSNAAANVTLATGTSGDDAATIVAVVAPDCVYGFQYARISVVVGGTTGTTDDKYTISYCYRQLTGSERC